MTEPPLIDTLECQNVVASTVIDAELDLQPLTEDLDGADYAHQPCPTLTYHPTETAAMIRLFRSGTLLAIGAANRSIARESLTDALGDLNELAIPVPATPDITIQNMVFTADLDTTLNLPAVVVALGLDHAEYEPEQHPSVIYRPADPAVVVLVFSTGKLVITGSTEPARAKTALTNLADQLAALGLRDE